MHELIVSIFSDTIRPSFSKVWTKLKYYWYHFFVDKFPYSEKEAKEYAYGVVSGQIDKITSFHNFSENRSYILATVKENKDDFFLKLVLLKKIGNTFVQDWEHKLIRYVDDIHAIDIQKKGVNFILFIEESYGSGGGTKTLHAFNSVTKESFQVIEHYNWSDLTRSSTPTLDLVPKNMGKEFFELLEAYASTKGMLNGTRVDFSKPEHAIQNWHRMNGDIKKGEINLCFYPGKPVYGSGILETEDTSEIEWIAYFKGPLFGYLKQDNTHFVAYSPGWTYNWPHNIDANNKAILFKSGGKKFVFELKGSKGILR